MPSSSSLQTQKKKKRHGRKERTEERKWRDVGRARSPYYTEDPSFSGVFRSRSSSSAEKEGEVGGGREGNGEQRSSEKGGPHRGHVSQPGHLPLKRTHCYVPIISFTLAQPPLFLALRLFSPPPPPSSPSPPLLACPSSPCV